MENSFFYHIFQMRNIKSITSSNKCCTFFQCNNNWIYLMVWVSIRSNPCLSSFFCRCGWLTNSQCIYLIIMDYHSYIWIIPTCMNKMCNTFIVCISITTKTNYFYFWITQPNTNCCRNNPSM